MKYRWVSWYAVPGTNSELGKFELHHPWWISGERCADGASVICAAIPVESGQEAEKIVHDSHDKKAVLEWRFNDPLDGPPFCDRFPRAKWMKWPAAPRPDAKREGA